MKPKYIKHYSNIEKVREREYNKRALILNQKKALPFRIDNKESKPITKEEILRFLDNLISGIKHEK